MADLSCKKPFQRVVPPPLIIGDRLWGFTMTKGEAMQWHLRQAAGAMSPGLMAWHLKQAESNYEWGGKSDPVPGLARRFARLFLGP